ncbi:MAG: GNAT family N-acetyltransferase [bacterium]|nr:GNAT family N-acetyltransferase [bacterium]
MEILRLGTDDIDLATQTLTLLKGNAAPDPSLHLSLGDEQGYLLAAVQNNQPLGFLIAYLLPRFSNPEPMMLLYEIEVAATHRRQGVGRAMIDKLKTICHKRNCFKMWVLTNTSNLAACGLYTATGAERHQSDEAEYVYHLTNECRS